VGLNLLRETRDTMIDFGPRGTQVEIIADIDRILEQGVPGTAPLRVPPARPGTYTIATLAVKAAAFDEIEALLRAAQYDHVFIGGKIDMTHIDLERAAS
jgi:hypothetical protein